MSEHTVMITKKLVGTATATGAISMNNSPDYNNGKAAATYIDAGYLRRHSANITISGVATVDVEVNNDDPTVTADWKAVASFGSNGLWNSQDIHAHIRFNVSAYTSGTNTVEYYGSA